MKQQNRTRIENLSQSSATIILCVLPLLLILVALRVPVPVFRTLFGLGMVLLVLSASLGAIDSLRRRRHGKLAVYALLVADVDGTLVGPTQAISPRVLASLSRLASSGVRIALCTGRSPMAASRFLAELKLPGPHIFFDGALVASEDGSVEAYCLSPDSETLRDLAKRCRAEGLALELYARDRHYVEQDSAESAWHSLIQGVPAKVADFERLLDKEKIVKGELIATGEPAHAAVAKLEREFAGRLRFSRAKVPGHEHYELVNVVHPAVSKGEALRHLAVFLGVPLASTVAVGDGANDISLLEVAGLSVAMGNAPPAVQSAATVVTATVADDGLALAIENLLLT